MTGVCYRKTMRRFFLPDKDRNGDLIEIDGAEARHMTTVLRLASGDQVELFDGRGGIYTAVLETPDPRRIIARITACRQEVRTAVSPLTVAQCLLKGKKMELVVQKATELGAAGLLPLVSRFCENRGDRSHQEERWQRIMLESCKQCRRALPMAINPTTLLAGADFSPFAHRLLAWEGEQQAPLPTAFVSSPGPICVLLGPEGGLSGDDLAVLNDWHFVPFSLGPRILRGETAALAVISIIQYLTGELGPITEPPVTP